MRFSSFFLAALPLAVLASPTAANDESLESFSIEKRNAASIQKKLNAVLADVKALDSELNSFGDSASPSGTQVIALEGDEQQLEKDLNSTKSTVDAGAKLNSADSTTIYNFLNGQLLSSTKTLLQDFIDHYPGLHTTYGGLVHQLLAKDKAIVDGLAKSFIAKSSGSAHANGPALQAKYDSAFNAAITKYAS